VVSLHVMLLSEQSTHMLLSGRDPQLLAIACVSYDL
jgi:hypothetical protein